jgi:hypothetical protein
VLAALRNRLIPVRDSVADSLAAAVRTMSNCFNKALALLGLPSLEEWNGPGNILSRFKSGGLLQSGWKKEAWQSRWFAPHFQGRRT